MLSSKPVIDKVKSKLLISIQLWLILCSSSTVSFLVFDSFYFYSDCLLHACLGQVEFEKHKFWTCDFNVNLPAWLIEIVPQIITFPSSRNSKHTSYSLSNKYYYEYSTPFHIYPLLTNTHKQFFLIKYMDLIVFCIIYWKTGLSTFKN